MIYDQGLVDQLSALAVERFEGEVFRATGVSADPLAFSVNGGRWAPAARDGADVPVLYTSLARDGAIAEVVSYLTLLTPLPFAPAEGVARSASRLQERCGLRASALEGHWASTWRDTVSATTAGHRVSARRSRSLVIDGLIAPSARWTATI